MTVSLQSNDFLIKDFKILVLLFARLSLQLTTCLQSQIFFLPLRQPRRLHFPPRIEGLLFPSSRHKDIFFNSLLWACPFFCVCLWPPWNFWNYPAGQSGGKAIVITVKESIKGEEAADQYTPTLGVSSVPELAYGPWFGHPCFSLFRCVYKDQHCGCICRFVLP